MSKSSASPSEKHHTGLSCISIKIPVTLELYSKGKIHSLSRLCTILYHQNTYLKLSSANFTLNFTPAPAAWSCPLLIHTNMWRGRKEPQVKYSTWHKSHPNINLLNNPCQNLPNIHTLLPFLSIPKKIRSFYFRSESVNDEQACTLTKE